MVGAPLVAAGRYRITSYNVCYTKLLRVRQVKVSTTFQGDTVQLHATFQTLHQSGLNYCAFAEATVPAKQLSVQMQNYNYARLAY